MNDEEISAEVTRIVQSLSAPFQQSFEAHTAIVALIRKVRFLKRDGTPRKEYKKPFLSPEVRAAHAAHMRALNAQRRNARAV